MQRQLDDLRVSFRLLAKHPGFTVLVVLILGLGIGANTAVFSLVRGVILRPLPYPEPERLVSLREVHESEAAPTLISPPTFRDWREGTGSLDALAAYTTGYRVLREGEEPRRVETALVTPGFFPTLGVTVSLGRPFQDEDFGGDPVVIPSHAFWIRSLGGDPGAVGRTLVLDDESHRIVGVAPPGFELPADTDLWLPLDPDFARGVRGAHVLFGIGRMAHGATPERVQSELSAISGGVAEYQGGWASRVVPLHQEIVGEVRTPLLILLGAVLFVLLVASSNVANLILARTFRRQREIAVRTAMGASRGRVVSLVLTESLLLALLAGIAGVLMAIWSLDLLLALVPGDLPRASSVSVDLGVLTFALCVSLVTGILAGLAPALRAARGNVVEALKESSSGAATGGREAMRLRGGLVVAETALTVLLLAGAGLLARSFLTITGVDPGFRAENVLAFDLPLPAHRYPESAQWRSFFDGLTESLEDLPQVRSVGLTRNPPLKGRNMSSPVRIEGRTDEEGSPTYVQVSTVSTGFFRTLGVEVLEGRAFQESDDQGSSPVAVVNRAFAETFFPGEDPVGERARSFFDEPEMREIVGVVENVHHHALTEAAPPAFYTPRGQSPSRFFTVLIRTEGDPGAAVGAVREVVRRADPGLPLAELATMEELLSRTVAGPRFYMITVGVFALLAVILAVAGLYGVMAGSVARRRKEMGIRFAVGAAQPQVLGLVLREALLLSGVGVGLGLLGALGLTRILESLLFEVSPADPVALLGGAGLTLVAAVLTAGVPALRAARVNPAEALRS